MEADLVALLQTQCPRVFPDVAPLKTPVPYVTWQAFGGKPQRFIEGAPASLRNTFMQINAWAATRAEALALIRRIEDALCADDAPFTARPQSEPMSTAAEELKLYGCMQDYEIWSAR